MKVCTIVPTPLLHVTKDDDYFISLFQVLRDNPTYMQFMKDRLAEGKYVFTDNGQAEGENPTPEEMLPILKELHPREVILPDVICNYAETLRQTREAYMFFMQSDLPEDIMFFAVPQGATFAEWVECMKEFIRQPNIVTLGVSKFVTPQFQAEMPGENVRKACVDAIFAELAEVGRDDLEVHLLGCWEDAEEIKEIVQAHPYIVRGCDSAFAYVFARAGKTLEAGAKRPDNHEIDFHNGTVEDQELLLSNINTWVETCLG